MGDHLVYIPAPIITARGFYGLVFRLSEGRSAFGDDKAGGKLNVDRGYAGFPKLNTQNKVMAT